MSLSSSHFIVLFDMLLGDLRREIGRMWYLRAVSWLPQCIHLIQDDTMDFHQFGQVMVFNKMLLDGKGATRLLTFTGALKAAL